MFCLSRPSRNSVGLKETHGAIGVDFSISRAGGKGLTQRRISHPPHGITLKGKRAIYQRLVEAEGWKPSACAPDLVGPTAAKA